MNEQTRQMRRRQRSAGVRRAILDATEAVLVDGGPNAFSIRRLVERCGYSAPTIYHHFGDKEGLLDALLRERYARLAGYLRRSRNGDDPVEQLRSLAKAYVRFGVRHPNHYQLLFHRRAPDRTPPTEVDEVRVQLERVWTGLWEAGRLRSGDPEAASQSLWVLCHGLVSGHILRPDLKLSKTLVDDSIDALLRGLVAADPPAVAACKPESRRAQA